MKVRSVRKRVPLCFSCPLARLTPLSPRASRPGIALTDQESARKFTPWCLFSGAPSLRKKLLFKKVLFFKKKAKNRRSFEKFTEIALSLLIC